MRVHPCSLGEVLFPFTCRIISGIKCLDGLSSTLCEDNVIGGEVLLTHVCSGLRFLALVLV